MMLAWIRFPGLPGFLYKKKILEEIGGIIGKVVWLDFNTDSRTRGRFARMVVYVNLDKPLIAQVIVNDLHQKVEYEGLLALPVGNMVTPKSCATLEKEVSEGNGTIYGPWMVVEKKIRRNSRNKNLNKADFRESGKSGTRFDALENMKAFVVEDETNKENEVGRPSAAIRIDNGEAEPSMSKTPNMLAVTGPVGCLSTAIGLDNGAVDPSMSKTHMDTSCSVLSQPNGMLGSSCAGPSLQNKKTGGFYNLLNTIALKNSTGAESTKSSSNFSSLSPMKISCVNPVIVGQEESEGDGSNMQPKSNSSVPEPFNIQVVDSSGGLDTNRHTAVSFNEKGPAWRDLLRKNNEPSSGGNKIRNLGKSMRTKDGGFRATKKINKFTQEKGINFKAKNNSKFFLSDSMSRLAQTVSILRGVDSEVNVPDPGKIIQE
ncbi:LINE-type retrotransposon LIb DNA, Insertion at the S11 site-like protein [Gossypium australe]|uniref:LINE-type retrotransposon LIb DNA, Insertion at the S11 site-like protein n=1 Tax=Gossypium australe TaxID=47621 RepID=A0A5B6W1I9_9ROSI|nr:LINE-type retrotransposon LIb DNA, Insertion at the S11 site-like protein [Gossypium australe]